MRGGRGRREGYLHTPLSQPIYALTGLHTYMYKQREVSLPCFCVCVCVCVQYVSANFGIATVHTSNIKNKKRQHPQRKKVAGKLTITVPLRVEALQTANDWC